MKKIVKLLGIIALAALIGLCFWACEEPKSESTLNGTVSIIGIAQVEEELTVDTSTLKGSGEISYQWKRNGTVEIGWGGSSYVIDETDIGSFITVTVTRSGYSGSVTSAPTAIVTNVGVPVLGGMVTISGTAMVDQIFTADTSGLGGSGTITYQWTRNGIDIIGTNSTYIVQNADIGSTITVTVTRGDNSGSVTSQPTIPVTDPTLPALTGSVSINGTAQVGQTLTANTSALGGSGTITYQWRQSGTTVVGTNSPTYTVTTAGYTITVTVTCSENSSSITSAPTGAAADDPSLPPIVGNVNVNGITQVGQALTADISSLGGSGTIHYRWQRNGADIGTNSNAYILIFSDVGSTITVSVSRQGYSGNVTSTPTAVIVSDLDANGLRYRLINNNTAFSVSKGMATDVNITIQAVYNGLPVTTIPENGFANYTNLTSIFIPESITEVGDDAFYGCTNLSITWNYNPELTAYNFKEYLKEVNISDSVTSIGWAAFSGCSSLTSITIPNSVTSIDRYAFSGCSSLSITWYYNPLLSYDSGSLSTESFFETYLKTVIIPVSVTARSDLSYYLSYFINLTSINTDVNDLYYSSQDGILYNKSKTEIVSFPGGISGSFTIPNDVTRIGDYVFYGCSSLTSITIPNDVTSIGNSAFSNCSSLTSITIPNGVTRIGDSTFSNCSSLTSITIPNSVISIDLKSVV